MCVLMVLGQVPRVAKCSTVSVVLEVADCDATLSLSAYSPQNMSAHPLTRIQAVVCYHIELHYRLLCIHTGMCEFANSVYERN